MKDTCWLSAYAGSNPVVRILFLMSRALGLIRGEATYIRKPYTMRFSHLMGLIKGKPPYPCSLHYFLKKLYALQQLGHFFFPYG